MMKRQQEEMDKKLIFLKNKEYNINKVKNEKENYKRSLLELNNRKKTELDKKRKKIESQKELLNKG